MTLRTLKKQVKELWIVRNNTASTTIKLRIRIEEEKAARDIVLRVLNTAIETLEIREKTYSKQWTVVEEKLSAKRKEIEAASGK